MAARDIRGTSSALSALMLPFAVLAGLAALQLYVFPADTDRYFAWTLAPPPSATFMGAGFAAGVVITIMSFRRQPWAVTRTAALSVVLFAALMTLATFMHVDRMHLGGDVVTARIAAWLWVIVYVVVPPVLTGLVILQWRRPGGDPPRSAPLPPLLRASLAALGAAMVVVGSLLFVRPGLFESSWPWDVTPLAGRAMAAWVVAIGFAGVWVPFENDVRRVRPAATSFAVAGVLWLLGAVRGAGDIHWDRVSAWLYLLVAATAVGLGVWGAALAPQSSPDSALGELEDFGGELAG